MMGGGRGVVRGTATPEGRIRVLVVDDSAVIRHLVRAALSEDPHIEVVGAEANGVAALARIPVVKPDVMTLDIEMPQMDGLETLRQVRKLHPHIRVLMFSTLTTRGAGKTLEALALGADDYVAKAANAGSLDKSLESLRTELVPKIKQFFAIKQVAPVAQPPRPRMTAAAAVRAGAFQVLGIGSSTGGPQALGTLIARLPALPVPVLLVQHMPPMFTRLLAERLHGQGGLRVVEATDGMRLEPGLMLVAPGGYHLSVRKPAGGTVVAALTEDPPENSCRPSVDVLFRSLADVYGGRVLSVVLTGMGRDGLAGTRILKSAGGYSIVQDEASSVVWGMPGAVAEAGLADQILPLPEIAPQVEALFSTPRDRLGVA